KLARTSTAAWTRWTAPSGTAVREAGMATVMTVTGPVEAGRLGFTLMHEHLLLDLMRDAWIGNNILNDPELAEPEVLRFKGGGGRTLVDTTNRGLAQDPLA